jgi:hypothetical protein
MRELQVVADPRRLSRFGLTVPEVVDFAFENISTAALRKGGELVSRTGSRMEEPHAPRWQSLKRGRLRLG